MAATLGYRMQRQRKMLGMTQLAVAKGSNISNRTISKIENNEVGESAASVQKLKAYYAKISKGKC